MNASSLLAAKDNIIDGTHMRATGGEQRDERKNGEKYLLLSIIIIRCKRKVSSEIGFNEN